jgi:hypothetical protein
MTVLEAGGANIAHAKTKPPSHLSDEVFRSHGPLFDPQEEEVSFTARLVRGDLFDLEVFGLRFDFAANAGKTSGEQGRQSEGLNRWGHGMLAGS